MDQNNFIIFVEEVYAEDMREISHAFSVYRNILLKEINNYAQTKGVKTINNIE
jgi:hypothetical protein